MSVFGVQAPDAGNVEILHTYATDEQRERYLRPLVEGKIRSCFSMTEPEMPGSNPVMMATTAVKDGDDYVINGQKWFTSSADGADFAIVMAVTDPDAPPHQRASMIIVPTDTPGFDLVRNISVMGDAGSGPRESRRGPLPLLPGAAVEPARRRGRWLRHRAGTARARAHPSLHALARHRRSRVRHDVRAGQRAGDHARRRDARRPPSDPALGRRARRRDPRCSPADAARGLDDRPTRRVGAARDEISAIKFSVASTMLHAVDKAIQVHGALGVTDDTVLSHWYRHERAARIYDGADEVHKTTLGRRILRRYASGGSDAAQSAR